MDIQQKMEALSRQLNELARHQTSMSKQIIQLMDELEQLKKQAATESTLPQPASPQRVVELKQVITPPSQLQPPTQPQPSTAQPQTKNYKPQTSSNRQTTLEEFVGGNLASKVGILVTIIGIFIGAKYAIENNLVNPLMRVISGYISGLVLIGIAIRLKKKYEQYSSVLMGGGLAVLYFITYTAYSFYGLIPQMMAFALMLVFTVGSVYAALVYNRIIIAHLGLVGAYAIPILLSDQSGRYAVLFTYIAIINTGILILSFRKYWKSLFYVSFALTWMIYGSWFAFEYRPDLHFNIAFIFLSLFFIIFYATFLAYKLIKKEQYNVFDVSVLLSNAFIFYGFGYGLLDIREGTSNMVGLFTLINAAIHLAVSLAIRKLKLADTALFYLLLGLVITFITIAIPVQLDGNWVTLLWTAEAVLVFFIGRSQNRPSYERLAVVLTVLSFLSLAEDWMSYLTSSDVFNMVFFTGAVVAVAQGAMLYRHLHPRLTPEKQNQTYVVFYDVILPVLLLLTTYFLFELEIQAYFNRLAGSGQFYREHEAMQVSTVLLYTMVFVAIVTYINERWIRSKVMGGGALIAILACIIALLVSLPELNNLAGMYRNTQQTYFGSWGTLIRYALIGAAALLLWLGHRSAMLFLPDKMTRVLYSVFTHITILTILSYEYLNWTSSNDSFNEYKLGLSIVWSIYALFLVIMGINKKKRHWRLTGICFFIITLMKLFIYDLNKTSTISKTVSFISLGAILLLVSYLYNRYKDVILAEDEE